MKARTKAAYVVIAALSAFALSACGPTTAPIPQSTGEPQVTGTWKSDEAGEPQLVLDDDLAVTGSDGCNRIVTTYELTDGVVKFASSLSTLKACEGVDAWLSALKTAKIDGETMTVLNAAGEEIGTLHRAS